MTGYDLALAWRFARLGGWFRAGVIFVVCTVAVAASSGLLTLPSAMADPVTDAITWVALRGIVIVIVVVPSTAALMTLAHLASRRRRIRLAALRLVGAAPRRVRVLGALENVILAVPGVVLGLCLSPTVVAAAEAVLRHYHFQPRERIVLSGDDLVMVALGALVLFAVTGGVSPRTTARSASTTLRPSLSRLGVLAFGLVLWTAVMAEPLRVGADPSSMSKDDHHPWYGHNTYVQWTFGSIVLVALGLLVAASLLVRLLGDGLTRMPVSTGARIGGRRLQVDPTATGRLIGALSVGLFLTTLIAAFIAGLLSDPKYEQTENARRAGATVTVFREVTDPADPLIQELRDLPEVREVGITRTEHVGVPNQDDMGYLAYVGTCAQLRTYLDVPTCNDKAARWLDVHGTDPAVGPSYDPSPTPAERPASVIRRLLQEDGSLKDLPVEVPRDPVPARTRFPTSRDVQPALFIPSSVEAPWTSSGVDVRLAPGAETTAVHDLARAHDIWVRDPTRVDGPLKAMRLGAQIVAMVLATFLGLTALASAIDRANDSRRSTVMLRAAGTPYRTLVAAEAWQIVGPLATAGALAILLGALAALPFIRDMGLDSGLDTSVQWGTVSVMLLALVAVTVAVTLVAAGLVPRHIKPEDLRRE